MSIPLEQLPQDQLLTQRDSLIAVLRQLLLQPEQQPLQIKEAAIRLASQEAELARRAAAKPHPFMAAFHLINQASYLHAAEQWSDGLGVLMQAQSLLAAPQLTAWIQQRLGTYKGVPASPLTAVLVNPQTVADIQARRASEPGQPRTAEQVREAYITARTDRVIYDAENSTSYEAEIRQLISALAEPLPVEVMQAALDDWRQAEIEDRV